MTDQYAVIGHPISHSKSPQIHQMFAAQTGQDISYVAIDPLPDAEPNTPNEILCAAFRAKVRELFRQGYKGMNVTLPFKQEAASIPTVANLSASVGLVHAANTLHLNEHGELIANNTDGFGLVRDIRVNLGFNMHRKRILLMGAGGATRGVLYPLLFQEADFMPSQQTPSDIVIVNRTVQKALQICSEGDFAGIAAQTNSLKPFPTILSSCGYADLVKHLPFDIVINATSSGLKDEMPPLPSTIFAPNALAYDMMYGRETPFLKFSREHGAQVADGLGMLVEQAAEAFYLWRGVRPDTAPVIAALRLS